MPWTWSMSCFLDRFCFCRVHMLRFAGAIFFSSWLEHPSPERQERHFQHGDGGSMVLLVGSNRRLPRTHCNSSCVLVADDDSVSCSVTVPFVTQSHFSAACCNPPIICREGGLIEDIVWDCSNKLEVPELQNHLTDTYQSIIDGTSNELLKRGRYIQPT
ncbi:hypothetical protein GE21DRAFT_1011047 [Neurospora crassa]|nr:hypothetical protein GE21DRAFT_1011047 [Neurospora crassa]